MNNCLPIIISLFAGLSTLIGVIPICLNIQQEKIDEFIVFSLSFSMCVMLGISIFDLIPTAFVSLVYRHSLVFLSSIIVIMFLIIQIFFRVSRKKHNIQVEKGRSLYYLGIVSMISLIIHNIPEGIITYLSGIRSYELGIKMGCAILLHNIPEGICIAVPIYYATCNKRKAIFCTFISGFSELLGALLAYFFLNNKNILSTLDYFMMLAGVLMISLVNNEIYPKIREYNNGRVQIKGYLAGIIILVLLFLI